MKKFYRWNFYLSISLQILIGIDIINRCRNNISNLIIFFGLFIIVVVNDRLRMHSFYKDEKRYYLSIFISMIISIIIAFKVQGYVDVYIFIILYELILYTEGTISRLLIGMEVVFWLLLLIFRIFSFEDISNMEFWRENLLGLVMTFQSMIFYLITMFAYKALRLEKRKVDKLNKELELSFHKLKKQSEELEELTITKERNRVAGEIHDNLGHSLIALSMNLDVAEKIIDSDIRKARELIKKSHILTKESMDNLRMAVYALKEKGITTLRDSINLIISNLESTGNIKVEVNIDEKTEELLPEYKDVIYASIKESLTNSIKHGKADNVNIHINMGENKIYISIKDNGLGCSKLVKGNGLLGIEDRIGKIGGKVSYNTRKDQGFEIEMILMQGEPTPLHSKIIN